MGKGLKLVISLIIPQLVGGTAAYFTVTGTGSWYQSIQKPSWNPPNWIFAPVWTALYIMMGLAFYFVWKADAPTVQKRRATLLWTVQLLLNFLWSFLFVNQHQIGWALVEIICLWIGILATILSFAPIHKVAAWLLVPYICWVSFATLLTGAIWQLNQ
jgi:tryptophan-rich sensory protein